MPRNCASQRGFTLIEILVVVFIIGVILGFATLSLSGRALDDKVQEEARRLSEILRLARDEAGMTGLELGWLKTEDGYRFVALSDNGWAEYGERTPLRPRRVEEPLKMTVRVDDLPIETDNKQLLPQVMILSSGEMTPFAIELGAPSLEFVFLIRGNLLGEISMEKVDPDDLVLRES